METLWFFLTRALAVLIPLVLIGYAAGLWTGWIKWHTWKKEYGEVERDYHKLHDIHDVARATIPELEARRQSLTDDISLLAGRLGEFQQANESFEAESKRLNENLRASKRNYEAMEEIWRNKITKAEIRILQLEADLESASASSTPAPVPATTPASAAPSSIPDPPADTFPGETGPVALPLLPIEPASAIYPGNETGRLIPFPPALGETQETPAITSARIFAAGMESPQKSPRKAPRVQRAM